jgi:hypothetical protein
MQSKVYEANLISFLNGHLHLVPKQQHKHLDSVDK